MGCNDRCSPRTDNRMIQRADLRKFHCRPNAGTRSDEMTAGKQAFKIIILVH